MGHKANTNEEDLDDGGGKLGPVADHHHGNSNESSMNNIAPGVVDEYMKLFLPEELAMYGPGWFELPYKHDDGRTVYKMYKSRKQLGTNKGKAKKKGGATAAGKKLLHHSPPTKKPPPGANKKDKSQATKDYNSNDLIKDDDTIFDSDVVSRWE
jgi:hypothetical protein